MSIVPHNTTVSFLLALVQFAIIAKQVTHRESSNHEDCLDPLFFFISHGKQDNNTICNECWLYQDMDMLSMPELMTFFPGFVDCRTHPTTVLKLRPTCLKFPIYDSPGIPCLQGNYHRLGDKPCRRLKDLHRLHILKFPFQDVYNPQIWHFREKW